MRKHSDMFPLVLAGGGFAIYAILQNAYQNALQAWVVDWLKQHGYQEQLALVVSSLLPLVPNIGLAIAVIWFIYWYVKKDFEKTEAIKQQSRESPPTHDVSLFDAIWRAYFGEWKNIGEGERLPSEQEYQRLHDLAEFDIPQRAFDGDLPIWGKRNALQLLEPIPKAFWQTHNIHYLSLTNRNPPRIEIWSTTHPIRPTHEWIELKTSRSVVDQLWPRSPLEIIFDPSNPGRKFFSIEAVKDELGKTKGTHWEYRALIKNNSSKTLKNVKAIVEAVGPLPHRPEPSYFDINKQQLIDLHPQDEALAIIRRWYNPPIVVGMAAGADMYGPIKMTVSANDVPPTTKFFHFDPERTPMIFE
jgi:hypothetical protein